MLVYTDTVTPMPYESTIIQMQTLRGQQIQPRFITIDSLMIQQYNGAWLWCIHIHRLLIITYYVFLICMQPIQRVLTGAAREEY